jgi:hypothetical protein
VVSIGLAISTEEDGCAEDPLESLDQAAIMESVFGQAEEVEHLSGRIEPNLTGFLPEGERGNPYRDEAVLAKGETELWVSYDLQEEFAVLTRVAQLIGRWSAEGESTKDEGARVKC